MEEEKKKAVGFDAWSRPEFRKAALRLLGGAAGEDRSVRTLLRVLVDGATVASVAAGMKLTPERVRQLFAEGCRKLSAVPTADELLEENEELKRRCSALESRVDALSRDASEPGASSGLHGDDRRRAALLCSPLSDHRREIPARAFAVLGRLGCSIVLDATRLTEDRIESVPGAGRKTSLWIDDFLERLDPEFGLGTYDRWSGIADRWLSAGGREHGKEAAE